MSEPRPWICDFCNHYNTAEECISCQIYNIAVTACDAAARRLAEERYERHEIGRTWLNEYGFFAEIDGVHIQIGTAKEAAPFNALTSAVRAGPEDATIAVRLGPEIFRFESQRHWIDKAQSWFAQARAERSETLHFVCLDKEGRMCLRGADFARAATHDAYPVIVYEATLPDSARGVTP